MRIVIKIIFDGCRNGQRRQFRALRTTSVAHKSRIPKYNNDKIAKLKEKTLRTLGVGIVDCPSLCRFTNASTKHTHKMCFSLFFSRFRFPFPPLHSQVESHSTFAFVWSPQTFISTINNCGTEQVKKNNSERKGRKKILNV